MADRSLKFTPKEQREVRAKTGARDELPTGVELLSAQTGGASKRLQEDARKFPQFRWPALARAAGPIAPGDLLLAMARTGGGKSLFFTNVFDGMVEAGRCGLYVGLEQSPEILRVKWACLRADVDPRLVLAPRPEEYGTALHREAREKVEHWIEWQRRPEIRECAYFAGDRRIDGPRLKKWTAWAVDRGAEYLILDHVDRVKHGDGHNPFHEMSETMRLAKELAVHFGIAMLVASQVGRPGDALEAFMPPALHNARGGGTKEEEADTVLGIYRPLKPGVTDKDLKRVRQGLAGADAVVEPNTMGVRVLKHRLDGAALGSAVKLAVHHGRISDLPERDQYSTSYEGQRRI